MRPVALFSILLGAMLLTRLPMLAGFLHVQDASWAIFFLGGFYLRTQSRWALPGLLAGAVAIDLAAIGWMGVDNYCLTAAYWFVIPAYSSLWLGGAWLRPRATPDARGAGLAIAALAICASACFLLTNAGFYWLGNRVTATSWEGWVANFGQWYWPFVRTTLIYATAVLLFHSVIKRIRGFAKTKSPG